MEEITKRVPPQSLEAEQSVIGSMIMDREAIEAVKDTITNEDFYAQNRYDKEIKLMSDSVADQIPTTR